MNRRRFPRLFPAFVLAWACGADNAEAPRPPPAPQTCKSFSDLMPAFSQIIASGGTPHLQSVVGQYLTVADRPNQIPPAADVLRAIFETLSRFAAYPPEPGAPPGLICVPDDGTPPPITDPGVHPLCEVRRVLYKFVHQGAGIAALALIDPAASGGLDYIVGRPPSSSTPHYEVADAVARLCQNDVNCQINDTLDLVTALVTFIGLPEGKKMIDDTNALLTDQNFRTYLSTAEIAPDGGQSFGGEEGMVALVKLLLNIVGGMTDPSALDKVPVSVFPQNLQSLITPLIADAKLLLDPNRTPNVLRPLKKVLACYDSADGYSSRTGQDKNLIRMIYRLAFLANGGAGLRAFQIAGIVSVTQGLRQADDRGSLLYLINLFALAVRDDATAPNSAALACSTLFSHPEALADVATIFEQGVAKEAVCAVDTLVYGCAGGTQPACPH